MTPDPKLWDEPGRIAALRRLEILDTPPEEPFDKLTELVRTVLDVPIAVVGMIDSDRQWFKSIVGLSGCEVARDISFCTHTIQQRTPLMIPDTTRDPRFAANIFVTGDPFIRSYLGIPLITPDGYNIGALCVNDTKPRVFSANEIAILSSFATLVMNELELRQTAMSDALTGAMTRRAWVDAAAREIARSRRHDTLSSIIVFDIDHFKQVNDLFGHPAGDAVLQALVHRCQSVVRENDLLGRIGGEEFALLLPDTDACGAADLAERLRGEFVGQPVAWGGAAQVTVSASFGVCTLDDSLGDVGDWLAAADRFLYEAKNRGRNRCHGSAVDGDRLRINSA